MKQMPQVLLAIGLAMGLTTTMSAAPAYADWKGCPPGLAKKHNGCTPPGHAKKYKKHHKDDRYYKRHSRDDDHHYHRYRVGDRIEREYIVIREPARYGLDPRNTYYRVDDDIFQVDRQTRKVINFIGAAAALLN